MLNWIHLTDQAQLEEIKANSHSSPVLIFKHSTRCPVSTMAKMRLEDHWDLKFPTYYLDLLAFRSISNQIAEDFSVHHESPQVLVIKNGECIFDASHLQISVEEIKSVEV